MIDEMEMRLQSMKKHEIVKTKLMEICDVLGGEWHHQFVFSSTGEKEERIVISYPGRCDTGTLHKNEYREIQ